MRDVTERVANVLGRRVFSGARKSNAERDDTTTILQTFRQLVETLKQARVGYIMLSEIIPAMADRVHGYRNCRRMAINEPVGKFSDE